MKNPSELRALAEGKRASAALARRAGPRLSLAADQVVMLKLSEELETEAAGLDSQADALECPSL